MTNEKQVLLFDDIFAWEGFGGRFRIGAGKCRLRIFDLSRGQTGQLPHLRPFLIVASDVADSRMTVKSCVSHLATSVVNQFGLDPQRMIFVEYYPCQRYGLQNENIIPERFEAVDFEWHEGKALYPHWRPLKPPLLNVIKQVLQPLP
ncbi:MAG: hypothetical protein AMJ54_02625 [Deltaproteobacteria bacterium SG8_13]|nr:MAG: hypothetical protein AMJ54_02625 [Deltaproteobacteria bacterium SG8_13]